MDNPPPRTSKLAVPGKVEEVELEYDDAGLVKLHKYPVKFQRKVKGKIYLDGRRAKDEKEKRGMYIKLVEKEPSSFKEGLYLFDSIQFIYSTNKINSKTNLELTISEENGNEKKVLVEVNGMKLESAELNAIKNAFYFPSLTDGTIMMNIRSTRKFRSLPNKLLLINNAAHVLYHPANNSFQSKLDFPHHYQKCPGTDTKAWNHYGNSLVHFIGEKISEKPNKIYDGLSIFHHGVRDMEAKCIGKRVCFMENAFKPKSTRRVVLLQDNKLKPHENVSLPENHFKTNDWTVVRFTASAQETYFEFVDPFCFTKSKKGCSVLDYYSRYMKIQLKYPNLFMVVIRNSKNRICYVPLEFLIMSEPVQFPYPMDKWFFAESYHSINLEISAPSQKSRDPEHMMNDALYESYAALHPTVTITPMFPTESAPHFSDRYEYQTQFTKDASLLDSNLLSHISQKPEKFYEACSIEKCAVVYIGAECKSFFTYWMSANNIGEPLVEQMKSCGMNIGDSHFKVCIEEDLMIFHKDMEKKGYSLLVYIIEDMFRKEDTLLCLQALTRGKMQHLTVRVADVEADMAKCCRIYAEKINLKFGGLNYLIPHKEWNEQTLLIGIDVSFSNELPGKPITVGFAYSTNSNYMKFDGGWYCIDKHAATELVQRTMVEVFKNEMNVLPNKICVYIRGILKEDWPMGAVKTVEDYLMKIQEDGSLTTDVSVFLVAPTITDDVCTFQNEPLEEGKFYVEVEVTNALRSRTKFNLMESNCLADDNIMPWKTLTEELCQDQQMAEKPLSIPTPIFVAQKFKERGIQVKRGEHTVYLEPLPSYPRFRAICET